MQVLTFTSLYPNAVDPRHGIFVKSRMDHFDQIAGASRTVIAPVQYVPLLGLNPRSRFHRYNQVPPSDHQGDIAVYHPRYMTIPGTNIINSAQAMTSAAQKVIRQQDMDFDLVDGHYLYPDGVAAFRLAKAHGKPLVLTARGSDVNFWMEQDEPKKDILAAINYAAKVICVSHALKDRLIDHGVAEDKLTVIMNGVDRTQFNADGKISYDHILTVGNLVPLKGHLFILQALKTLPGEKLVIIGAGELEGELKNLARQLNVSERVSFLPNIPHSELPDWYRAAKCTVLMSSMEGMPNVVLESLACGTPVVATNVGGIPEVITKDNGILLPTRDADALAVALKDALTRNWDREKISQGIAYLDWSETARKLRDLFSTILNHKKP
ncbi:MAG: glycosyl transferase family 1 [Alphaproteobacteria bacterium]|nr:MAG: glycosyl transferase family 1 [Alphaproteobacteria bacterium]